MDGLPNSDNLALLEAFYESYLRDPSSVPPVWQHYFEQLPAVERMVPSRISGPSFRPSSLFNPAAKRNGRPERSDELTALQHRVDLLIRNFRVRGHMIAQIDPLKRPRSYPDELDPGSYGFTEAEMDRVFSCETIQSDGPLPLREIVRRLRNTYCRSIGAQYMHIDDIAVRTWLQERMERTENRIQLEREEQIRILARLTDAVVFEEFIRKKYLGAKTFSLEGAESLIPLLDLAIEQAAAQGIEEIVLGMAHRGRLNVLANVIGESPREIFRGFEDADPELYLGRGDVVYHLGYSNDYEAATGRVVHLSLCFNPSHLEFVGPVALGRMRAKQDRAGNAERDRGMVLLIHGDAAFAGEGVVQETLNLSQLDGYCVGGTLHVIINNQIGFTTAPEESRSSAYASDVAKMLQIPIFHVNGEDPEAVAQVIRLSMDFRRTFKRDVVIDMYAYRKLGHNEGDEPSFTQPLLYQAIEKRKPVGEGYLDHLLELNEITREEADRIAAERREELEKELSLARGMDKPPAAQTLGSVWEGYCGGPESEAGDVETGVDRERLAYLIEAQTRLPEGFRPHPKIERAIEMRREMADGARPLDWSAAESLALATLATEGHRIRLTGQDTGRGTFSQRHAVLHDYGNGTTFVPLQHLSSEQAPVDICNSPLSECGVLGFEYGYSLDFPEGLTLWEAQFGDFSNAAQVIIDQFLASAEDKWRRLSGIVLLLPHGFEGMGPEHSSARLERFLQLCAEDNIQVVCPTTPAQYFHCLRRQVLRRWRKPLVIMTPKSLLRHPRAVSGLEQLSEGRFERILADTSERRGNVDKVILCTGKIYYALEQAREELERKDVAILRLEQLYPLPDAVLASALASYPDGTPVVWVQEEPENMGAWHYLRVRYGDRLWGRLPFSGVSRPESASPATGSKSSHYQEQERLLALAFEKGRSSDES